MPQRRPARVLDFARASNMIIWSAQLSSVENINRELHQFTYGTRGSGRITPRYNAFTVVSTDPRDCLVSPFFELNRGPRTSLMLELEWSGEWDRRPAVLLQAPDFRAVATFDAETQGPFWQSAPIDLDKDIAQLRVALILRQPPHEYALPLAIRVRGVPDKGSVA